MKETIVMYPCPGRSHLVPMVELAKLILTHHPCSFSITFIVAEPPNSETESGTTQYIQSISTKFPSIIFHELPTISSTTSTTSLAKIETVFFELPRQNNPNFHQALSTLSNSSIIKAVIMDFFCIAACEISKIHKIPTYFYITGNLSATATLLYLPTFHNNSTKSFIDIGDELIYIPGMPVPIPAKDMPHSFQDRNSKVYGYYLDTAVQLPKSAGIIVNTIETLEERALKAISDGKMAPIYCVGPLILSSEESKGGEDEHECMSWLDFQPKASVVFLSFGSMGKFCGKQLKEIALGLERSGIRFLWVVRPPEDAAGATLESLLPQGFLERTKNRGYVAKNWAPQVAVLSHDSVGGFVTHCGWNSAMEALRVGVPMLAWPLHAEQGLCKVVLVEELKVALPVVFGEDGLVSAAELEKRVTELMDSEKRKLIKERIVTAREKVLGAFAEGGPSRVALAKLVESLKRHRE